jgi:hypothetical protein
MTLIRLSSFLFSSLGRCRASVISSKEPLKDWLSKAFLVFLAAVVLITCRSHKAGQTGCRSAKVGICQFSTLVDLQFIRVCHEVHSEV